MGYSVRESDYLTDVVLQAEFATLIANCDVDELGQVFLASAGITSVPIFAYCVMSEGELQKDIIVASGDFLVVL